MDSSPKRILFVNSGMLPYLPEDRLSVTGRALPQGIQEKRHEIRTFLPRYGCINERKHQLHEVIRLSGMNIIINDVDHPLMIKVASIPSARMQVYFINNEDFFQRKPTERTPEGVFFEDNDERAIFYARGVLETVKKLRWAPDVIHCQGWISQVLPLFLKKVYKDDPIFAASKVVLALDDSCLGESFSPDFAAKLVSGSITAEDVAILGDSPTGTNLAKLAARYSDGIILSSDNIPDELLESCTGNGLPVLPYDAASMESGKYVDEYNVFYESL